MNITVIGLGEAGSRYAADLAAAGHVVSGYDPAPVGTPNGVTRATTLADAVGGAELVISLTPSQYSEASVAEAVPALAPHAVWADFSSGSPEQMARIGRLLAEHGITFADVAVLGPVPMAGAATDVISSGDGAALVAEVLGAAGANVEVLAEAPGAATARKLLRSVMMKGFAVVASEAAEAAEAAGQSVWMREQLASQLAGGQRLVERFLSGTKAHAGRRAHEMRDVADYLTVLGTHNEMSTAAAAAMERIAAAARQDSAQ